MRPHRRRLNALLALSAALVLSGCALAGAGGGDDQPSPASPGNEQPTVSATGDHGPLSLPSLAAPITAPDPASDNPRNCGHVDVDGQATTIYHATGEIDCAAAGNAVTHYLQVRSDAGGETLHAAFDGWECDTSPGPDAALYSAILQCSGPDGATVVLRPKDILVPNGEQIDAAPYLVAGSNAGFFFSSPSTKFHCAIFVDRVGCNGEVAPPATALVLGRSGPGETKSHTDAQFVRDDRMAPPLDYGKVVLAYGFACSIDPESGVTCSRGDHGFQVSSKGYDVY